MRNTGLIEGTWRRVAIATGVWITYGAAFLPLYRLGGPTVTLLAMFPAATTGLLFGMWAGALAAFLAPVLNVLLGTLAGDPHTNPFARDALIGTFLVVLAGPIAGQVRALAQRAEQELAERRATEQTLERRNREMALVNRVSQALNATLDLDQVLVTVLEGARSLMGVIASSIWLIEPPTNGLVCRQATGPHKEVVQGWRLAPGEGIAGWVADHGESLIVPDALEDERHATSVGQKTGILTRSILNVPLRTSQGVIGVLQVMDEQADHFDTEDLALLEPLAAEAAIAIENARLVKALRQHTVELEARNQELDSFAYVASHNLRTPLVTLRGFAAELRHTLEMIEPTVHATLAHLDAQQKTTLITALEQDIPEALDFLDSSVVQIDSLTHALFELSRLSSRELRLERVDMDTLIQETIRDLSPQIDARQVKVVVGSLPPVIADWSSMRLILDNLVSNAVLYLSPGRPGEIEITAETDHHETTFRIRDNGRGIADDDMHKVFAPFRRIGQPDVPGEGMGLAYVQALIRRHGGRIWCESQLGVGTTFTFTIPSSL
jgi:signal transduction histidine kinase